MKITDLSFSESPKSDLTLKGAQAFIYQYGLFNCKILKFKKANEVLQLLESHELNKQQKEFILQNSNKKVLCYLCHSWQDSPDIFVYGDDNIPFTVRCFV